MTSVVFYAKDFATIRLLVSRFLALGGFQLISSYERKSTVEQEIFAILGVGQFACMKFFREFLKSRAP